MRVALVTGVLVEHDAISNAVLQERDVLEEDGHDVSIFCQGTTFENDSGVVVGADPWMMSQHAGYRDAKLVVLHFGTGYELFDALLLEHDPNTKRVVRFHNVTPPTLLSGTHRSRAQRGLDQVVIAERADHIWCDSEYNRRTLIDLGIAASSTTVLRLCVPDVAEWLEADLGPFPMPPTVLFVGRLVEAKGVLDLLDAFELSGLGTQGVRLVLAGNTSLSDPEVVSRVRSAAAVRGSAVTLVADPSDDDLAKLYEAASVFAMPSYHEGFCVPVVEAMARGLVVVHSDAGALPDTVGPGGLSVPVGDVEVLGAQLLKAVGEASGDRIDFERSVLESYTRPAFGERLNHAISELGR